MCISRLTNNRILNHPFFFFFGKQTEITRTYIKPPPNKTALDVPEHAYSVYPPASSCNNLNQRTVPTTKTSKSNVITKAILRVFSPKSPETTTRSSTATVTTPMPHNPHHHHYNHHAVVSAASSAAMSSTISIQKSAAYSTSAVSNHNTTASNTTLPTMLVSSSTSSESSTTTTKSLPPSPSPEAGGAHI